MSQEGRTSEYSNTVLVTTEDGKSYFGMHNHDFYDPTKNTVTLSNIRGMPTPGFNSIIGLLVADLARAVGAAEALEVPRSEIFKVMMTGGCAQHFNREERVVLDTKNIRDMADLPDFHPEYHTWEVDLRRTSDED